MTKQYHLDQTSHASSHIKESDQSYQTLPIGLIMLGPLPFLSPLRELYNFESSTMRFQWSGNSYKHKQYNTNFVNLVDKDFI